MPLSQLKIGERARIVMVKGTDVVKHHLCALGFVPGVVVSVVQISYGNMIFGIHDSRIAIDGANADRVLVQAVKDR